LTDENPSATVPEPLFKKQRADLVVQTKASPKPLTFQERLTIMSTHSSAQERVETPHANDSTTTQIISDDVKRRAQSLINDRTIDANGRAWLRYALEINDPALPELVRRAEAGEPVIDDSHPLEPTADVSTETLEAVG
jgi:hypothetical protein